MFRNRTWFRLLASVFLTAAGALSAWAEESYDPTRTGDLEQVSFTDLKIADAARQREVPIRVYLGTQTTPSPVILFSPGLGGSREFYGYVAKPWAARGYSVVVLQHPGSDSDVWQQVRPADRATALRQAVNPQNFLLRAQDVSVVLDQLQAWSQIPRHAVGQRLDLGRVGMSGHSFGAVTTQSVSGERFGRAAKSLTDARIKAAIAMSPSVPRQGDAKLAFGDVKIPWLLMTGTKDDSPIGNVDVASRLAVFPTLPPGEKYELVLNNAEHSAFSDRALAGDRSTRNPNHHKAIIAISTAFWDAYLKEDAAAKAWLDGAGAKSALESGDRWQVK
ncbi:alpha/beta hydrolase family protein [Planctomicrobium piriforme]|uniref:Predicted dienelactone hydrolase n=1 Tax=Planctomicrobium piriforme TaxID=1576369 RepID=A0A1I3D7W0_9PLAN|nr:dienelactone hydrolase [Planctomicrobium piriforme]SFH82777.1 Predicted dienelactone hydrolase [Planctomicrobium piriforme]